MHRAFWMLFIASGFFVGCGKSSTETTRPANVNKVAELNSEQAQVVRPSTVTGAQSPADSTGVSISIDSPPNDICRFFIERLREGDTSKAERLMTQKSILEARNKQLSLSTPVGPGAHYHLGETQYATSKKEVAFVPCEVIQTIDGESVSKEFSMMLKNGRTGWKIAGMLVPNLESQTQDLLSFENPDDVAQIKEMVDPESRQANLPGTNSIQ